MRLQRRMQLPRQQPLRQFEITYRRAQRRVMRKSIQRRRSVPNFASRFQPADGEKVTHLRCKGCDFTRLAPAFHKNWARHCNDYKEEEDDAAKDQNDDEVGDDAEPPPAPGDAPGAAAGAAALSRGGELLAAPPAAPPVEPLPAPPAAGERGPRGRKPAAEPKKRCEPKKAELPAAAPKRGRMDSAGDQGTQIAKPKSKLARKKT